MPDVDPDAQPIVLVTGPSGAGRTTAINVLEDLGFEAIDNLPLRLLPILIEAAGVSAPMALGLDSRNRDFAPGALLDMIEMLAARQDAELTVLYLDARPDVLLRRYSETRRRHPLAPAETPEVGVAREQDLMAPIRERADMLLDTSEMNVHQLKAEIEHWFAPDGRSLALSVQSFSYKRGVPRSVDLVFDCRFLANPYWEEALRSLNGRDAAVQDYVKQDPLYDGFMARVVDMVRFLLPAFRSEGKSHLSIAFGCTGGQHRSVTLAETLAKTLAKDGQQVSIRHRELQR
ncbi:RNase adapter RapZ [Phaeobacter gallaeciensis]|uniref:RNase adapter RapZ n=1 Tax=Phaeobacter gallaeciensis TaxID=60890 RepID=UPI00237F3A05|nr:RNase adapter RapZ [Phaeobacter gallaeciensis]MDE4192418.1 RNase adapter RapZ [Phaeobacter gallaeciensis]MDE4200637.1 RNase adapter RapZ [Phaeobacter gallaeciensis]MDE4205034.1 RNase adapter RapZ [Phaeobacter gallaeciensis]MDE4209173.1 RNase adapter RapZ [Phaeobacter gallaeciensis]MDE4217541.1 RNase adapter RapZ [Phaeobacter gallaeciensis]